MQLRPRLDHVLAYYFFIAVLLFALALRIAAALRRRTEHVASAA